ncbi:metallophosphoesterase [Numidum massiliense]|uniref:metallophosphoesterase n=1 Tax=Numidum massiliense TaxID=1522315 RepID=UPI00094009BD|nr:metallophosphoesterase [Numidum massiliense]
MENNSPLVLTRRQFLKKSTRWVLGACALGGLSGAYAYWVEPNWLEVKHVDVTLEQLPPAFHKFRIVHFSDLHLGHYLWPEDLTDLISHINELGPDLICFTGDFVDHETDVVAGAVSYLSQLRAPFGQLAVLGNHDHGNNREPVVSGLTAAGFDMLINEHVALMHKEETLYVAGVDDHLAGASDVEEALRGIPERACTILLSHEPDVADDYTRYPLALQLSGHSHGGQIRLPLLGSIYTPALAKKYTSGLYTVPDSRLQVYTTRGIGTTRLPLRVHCRPELSVITLHRA